MPTTITLPNTVALTLVYFRRLEVFEQHSTITFFFFLQYIVFYNLIPLFTLQCKECSNQQSSCPVYLYRYKKLPAYFNVFTIVAFVINYYALAIAPAIYLHVVSPLKVYYNNAWYYKYKMGVGNVIKFHIHIQINLSLPEN